VLLRSTGSSLVRGWGFPKGASFAQILGGAGSRLVIDGRRDSAFAPGHGKERVSHHSAGACPFWAISNQQLPAPCRSLARLLRQWHSTRASRVCKRALRERCRPKTLSARHPPRGRSMLISISPESRFPARSQPLRRRFQTGLPSHCRSGEPSQRSKVEGMTMPAQMLKPIRGQSFLSANHLPF